MEDKFKLENQLCFRLYTASRLLSQAYHPLLGKHNLTYPQYLVLLVLWEKDCLPVNDIAKRLYLETNTVTPLLKRMEADGVVSRSKGADDARQTIVRLTQRGRELKDLLTDVPETMGRVVLCDCVTPDSVPGLFSMLDDIISQLQKDKK